MDLEKMAGNGITAFWFSQKVYAMQGSLGLHFFRKMSGLVSCGVVVNLCLISRVLAGFQLAISCRLSVRHSIIVVLIIFFSLISAMPTPCWPRYGLMARSGVVAN